MSNPLIVTGDDPVVLTGAIDSSSNLQIEYSGSSLVDYGQSLDAEHDDLESPSATICVEIEDFAHGGDNWQITCSHDDNSTTVSWSRGTDRAYYDFAAMTDALEVDVVATSDASPPATKIRKVWIKTKPVEAQPDRP